MTAVWRDVCDSAEARPQTTRQLARRHCAASVGGRMTAQGWGGKGPSSHTRHTRQPQRPTTADDMRPGE